MAELSYQGFKGAIGLDRRLAVQMTKDRLGRAAAATVLSGLVVASLITPAAAASSCPPMAPEDWVSVQVPAFESGAATIQDYEVSPDGRVVALTNGTAVQITRDGGCRFQSVFNVEDVSYYEEGTVIRDLSLGSNDGTRLLLAIEAPKMLEVGQQPLGVKEKIGIAPHVALSDDGGASWVEADGGLESAFGSPLSIASPPGSSNVALLVDQYAQTVAGQASLVAVPETGYYSTNGGSNWTAGKQFGATGANQGPVPARSYDHLLADPVDPNSIWVYGGGGVAQSTDGGQTWAQPALSEILGAVTHLEIMHPSMEVKAQLIAVNSGATVPQLNYSIDGGGTWLPYPVREAYASTALFSGSRIGAAAALGGVLVHFPTTQAPVDISIGTPLSDIEASFAEGKDVMYARTSNAIYRRTLPPTPLQEAPVVWEEPPEPDPYFIDSLGGLIDPEEPQLLPADLEVQMRPGENRTLNYYLYLPGVRKVDVAFLVDTSDSMEAEINGLREAMGQIKETLERERAIAYYGVASYRAYDSAPYVRRRDIGPPGPELAAALNSLDADAGDKESSLMALYQLATGEGYFNDGSTIIPSGQQMNFRPDAIHVVVHGTDETPNPAPPNPTYEQVFAALRAKGIIQVGLAYENPQDVLSVLSGPPTQALGEIAYRTQAIAPKPVSCYGDSTPEIAEGAPLVCAIPSDRAGDPNTIGPAIASMILSLPDFRTVKMFAEGETTPVTSIEPLAGWPNIDFKYEQLVPFEVNVTCPLFSSDGEYEITPIVTAKGLPIADANLKVACSPIAPAAAAADPRLFLAVPPGQAPPPPQPPQVQSPVQQVQAQTQSQSQAQAQVGMVAQRQSQPQVAAVKVLRPSENLARVGEQGADDMSFSNATPRRHRDLPPFLFNYIAAAAIGTLLGVRLVARKQRAYATVRRKPPISNKYTRRRW